MSTNDKLADVLSSAVIQMDMAGDCIEAGRYNEALLHVRSLMRSRREVLAEHAASLAAPPAPGEAELPAVALARAVEVLQGMGYQWLNGTWAPYLPNAAPGSGSGGGAHNRLAALAQRRVPDAVRELPGKLRQRAVRSHKLGMADRALAQREVAVAIDSALDTIDQQQEARGNGE